MKTIFTAVVALAFLAVSSIAFAYPNLGATTGIVAVPTAEVTDTGAFLGAADIQFLDITSINVRAIYGLAPNWEVGAGLVLNDDDTQLGLNAKIRLPVSLYGMQWALGARYILADENNGTQIYFAGSRPIEIAGVTGASLLGTAGLSFTDIEGLSALRPFFGAQLRFPSETEIGAEFVFGGGDFDDTIGSFVIRQVLGGGWSGEIGVTNAIGFAGASDYDIFAGLSRPLY
ncbi:MAG: hypothetical protein ACYC7E_09695 [Armatimonadota bacterium]